jgi:hypothetical protein
MIQKRSTNRGVRYDVRVRDASGRVHTRTFSTKRAAEAYERDQLTKREQGAWTDPRSARTPFDLWARQWLSSDPAKRPKTLATDRNIIERHLVPALGSRPIGSISPSDVQTLVNRLAARLAPATVRRYYAVLRAILTAAVDTDRIGRSPCRGIKLPAAVLRDRHVLTAAEVRAIAESVPQLYRPMIVLGVETGLRFEECAALRVGRLALLGAMVRRRADGPSRSPRGSGTCSPRTWPRPASQGPTVTSSCSPVREAARSATPTSGIGSGSLRSPRPVSRDWGSASTTCAVRRPRTWSTPEWTSGPRSTDSDTPTPA